MKHKALELFNWSILGIFNYEKHDDSVRASHSVSFRL